MYFHNEYQGHQNQPRKNYLTSFQRKTLEKTLEGDIENKYRQRIKIMLLADEGKSQTEICQLLGCCQATARHWIMIARSGQAHCWKDSKIGRPKRVNEQYLDRLKELVSHSPGDYGYSFKRWTAEWLRRHLAKEFEIQVSDRYINQLLKQMGLSTKPKPNKIDSNHSTLSKSKNLLIQDLPNHNQIQQEKLLSFNLLKAE
ncbi:helix-turn-helix domain-containing protein [Crocosphaera sp. XPORK-15E]|uniref:helix-turn-helix domain-containing protein n=1 Tax=Crocosphaera sp. XPORK-15E TaxID=3110247 RepID=UPI002B1F6E35|nr:helix-turn-helix domain-containing protein [Crocosphaera sp. XPORK-15E]MEA5535801.1 helix-turn-helix domain-containing protein [Crocosphaera sp. XPORK-15E]